jgi:hypothetical protein
MDKIAGCIAAVVAALIGTASIADDRAPRYMDALREELARLNLAATCQPAAGTCTLETLPATAPGPLRIILDDDTATVYMVFSGFLPLATDGPSPALSQRLLELNARLVSARLEYPPREKAVRLSAVLHTDSNFDRRAFRSVLTSLIATAERIRPELAELAKRP